MKNARCKVQNRRLPRANAVTGHDPRVCAHRFALCILQFAFFISAFVVRPAAAKPADGLIASPEPGWPQFRGPRRDGVSEEKGLLPVWPAGGPRLLWKASGLGTGWSSPIVTRGRVFVTGEAGDALVITALDLDGRQRWQARNGLAWKGQYPGARSSCAYSQGRLYHMNAHGRVACLDARTGAEVWAVDALERFGGRNITWGLSESVLVDGPRVILTPGGTKALMVALDKRTGATVWQTEPIEGEQAAYASPILLRWGGRRFVAGCSSRHGIGVDAETGKLAWQVPLETQFHANVAGPAYADGSVFYVAPDGPNGARYRLAAAGSEVSAEAMWHTPLDSLTGGVIVVGGCLYGSGYRKDQSWRCLDWETGQTRYSLPDLAKGAALYADGRLYVLAEDGTAALLHPTPAGFEVAGRFQLAPARGRDAWAHPVVLDGRLYLRYHDTLWCYDVRRR